MRMSANYAILMSMGDNKVHFSTMLKGYKTPKLSICNYIASKKQQ